MRARSKVNLSSSKFNSIHNSNQCGTGQRSNRPGQSSILFTIEVNVDLVKGQFNLILGLSSAVAKGEARMLLLGFGPGAHEVAPRGREFKAFETFL